MGAGRSQEASFDLRDDVPAGTWTLIGDGVILQSVDVTFEVLLRRAGAGDVPNDVAIVSWQQRFEPLADGVFDAVPYQASASGVRIDYRPGDQLIFRYSGQSATSFNAYVPNGDGARQRGRIPNLTLPR